MHLKAHVKKNQRQTYLTPFSSSSFPVLSPVTDRPRWPSCPTTKSFIFSFFPSFLPLVLRLGFNSTFGLVARIHVYMAAPRKKI